jgi:hypothetical protein
MTTNGIYRLEDLLAQNFTNAGEFGFDNIVRTIQDRLDFVNSEVDGMVSLMAEKSTERRRVWGSETTNTMVEITDDLGSANSRKIQPGVEIAFPLRKFSVKTGWTQEWLKRATPAEIAKNFLAMENGYFTRLIDEIKFAVFNKDNYSYTDWLTDATALPVKAFLNADSAAIPAAPDGTTFTGSSHKHYVGTSGASLAYGDIDTLISNVREHGLTGLALFVNAADVAGLVGLASTKFVAITHAVLAVSGRTSGTVSTDAPESYDLNNRLAGYWDGIPVYTKPWVVDNYIVCAAMDARERPLVYRVDKIAGNQGLILGAEYGMHPITAKEYVAYYGFGAWNRAAVAVLDTAHQTNYTEPTLIR